MNLSKVSSEQLVGAGLLALIITAVYRVVTRETARKVPVKK